MSTLGIILLFTFIATVASLFLVAILLLHKTLIHKISFSLVSFAAGALLATGFLDTFPEAVEKSNHAFLYVTLSIACFFLIERLFFFLHHHEEDETQEVKLPTAFLLFGDAMHNFIDGASIAATFLSGYHVGLITSIAVFIHEIPHELGDFGILIHKGWGRGKVLWFNVITGATAFLGAFLAYYLGSTFEAALPVLLAITSGNFIYLSATDLLPEIHHKAQKKLALPYMIFFFLGIVLIVLLTTFVKG